MRNLLNKATGTAIAIAAAALLSSGSANAQAVVTIDIFECQVFDVTILTEIPANINLYILPTDAAGGDAVVQTVMTPSGNLKATCSAQLPGFAVLPDKGAAVFTFEDFPVADFPFLPPEGLLCRVEPIQLETDDWHMVITRSGRVSLTCHGQL